MIALLCFFLTLFASEFSVHTAAAPTLNFIRRRILAIFDANAPEITKFHRLGHELRCDSPAATCARAWEPSLTYSLSTRLRSPKNVPPVLLMRALSPAELVSKSSRA